MLLLRQPFIGGVADVFRSVMRVRYTFFRNISYMLLPTGFTSGKFWGPRLRWDKFWSWQLVFDKHFKFYKVVQRHYSGDVANVFAAALFTKRCTKFDQNRRSFVGDITKNILVFFPGHRFMVHQSPQRRFPGRGRYRLITDKNRTRLTSSAHLSTINGHRR